MSQLQPRPYQDKVIERIKDAIRRKVRRILVVMPCGSGKTVVFTYIAQGASLKQKIVAIIAHRKELILQCSDKLKKFAVEHGIIKAGYPEQYERIVQVASIQTLQKRTDKISPAVLIYDECHHSLSEQAQAVITKYGTALLMGFTASPIWNKKTLGGFYDELIVGPTVRELINEGYLVETQVYAPPPVCELEGVDYENLGELEEAMNKRRITGDMIDHYRQIAEGMSAIYTAVSVKHAEAMAEQFREAGYSFFAIHGESPDRDKLLEDFNNGLFMGLVSCDLISEGTDLPRARVLGKGRPTKSLGLNIQHDGRPSRPFYAAGMPQDTAEQRKAAIAASEKPFAIIIDHVANYHFHGWPDDEYQWSLTEEPRRIKSAAFSVNQCLECFRVFKGDACPHCGMEREIKSRKILYTEGELKLLKKEEVQRAKLEKKRAAERKKKESAERKAQEERLKIIKNRERKDAKTYPQLVAFATKYGYENPEKWAGQWMSFRNEHRGKKRN